MERTDLPDGPWRRWAISDFIQHLTVLYPDKAFPVLYAESAAAFLSARTPIPVMDLLIGVTARIHGLPLLTRERKHFHRIPGLVVEWYGQTDDPSGHDQ